MDNKSDGERTVFCTVLSFLNGSRFYSHIWLVIVIANTNTMGNLLLKKLNTYMVDFRFKLLYPQGIINLLHLILDE